MGPRRRGSACGGNCRQRRCLRLGGPAASLPAELRRGLHGRCTHGEALAGLGGSRCGAGSGLAATERALALVQLPSKKSHTHEELAPNNRALKRCISSTHSPAGGAHPTLPSVNSCNSVVPRSPKFRAARGLKSPRLWTCTPSFARLGPSAL